MKSLIFGTVLALGFSSSSWAASLNDNKTWALALELSYLYQTSPTQPVVAILGNTEVVSEEVVSASMTREIVAYDFFLYPSDDENLQIVGPASAYLGCKATVEYTQLPTPSKVPDFSAKIVSESCEASLIRKNPVTPEPPVTPEAP